MFGAGYGGGEGRGRKICGPANSVRRHDSLVYFRFTTGRSFLIYETTGRAGLVGWLVRRTLYFPAE